MFDRSHAGARGPIPGGAAFALRRIDTLLTIEACDLSRAGEKRAGIA
jgi:hypothetical protein